MKLIFLYGPPAAGKFTIARELSQLTGLPLFHNHLVVDAVASVFPFGSESFARLREQFWMETFQAAVDEDRSLIFTFQPETSVAPDFASRVADLVSDAGGDIIFVHLTLSLDQQLARIANSDRASFGKLRDPDLLRALHDQFEACEAAMPSPRIRIDTSAVSPTDAANRIEALFNA